MPSPGWLHCSVFEHLLIRTCGFKGYWRSQMREVVERGLRQDISSSPEMLKQATRHWGQPAGLQGVFRKLMQGIPAEQSSYPSVQQY